MTNYRKLTRDIHAPEGLNDRVLFQARRQAGAPQRRNSRSLFRAAICAMCALGLVLGGISLWPANSSGDSAAYTFSLVAYAAGVGDALPAPAEGKLTFSADPGVIDPDMGDFTGCVFQVVGEDIQTVQLSIDQGALYRYKRRTSPLRETLEALQAAPGEDRITPFFGQTEDGLWHLSEMTPLGQEAEEAYDAELRYGLRVPPEQSVSNTGLGITIESQMDLDQFDGAALAVTVTTTGGIEKTQVYRLHTGMLKVEFLEDGSAVFLPELAGPGDLCDYGVYAELET